MKKKFAIFQTVFFVLFVLVILAGCTSPFQQHPSNDENDANSTVPNGTIIVNIILNNEAHFDTEMTIRSNAFVQYANGSYIPGKSHTSPMLLTHTFGTKRFQKIKIAVLKNTFQAIVSETSGKSTTITIDPLKDHYIAINFWVDRFEVQKSELPIILID